MISIDLNLLIGGKDKERDEVCVRYDDRRKWRASSFLFFGPDSSQAYIDEQENAMEQRDGLLYAKQEGEINNIPREE